MKHGSLFSGMGGFDLAAEWMGWDNAFHCEWNPFGQKILKYYWPKAISYEDITKTGFTIHRGTIDILTGGFPCQPYSLAGKRQGKDDERHLWPEMLRAIREIQPRWVVGENVFGLINWNGGMVFDEVQADLEAEGYEVFPYVLPACAVNAPHRRDRVWFVAYSNNKGGGSGLGQIQKEDAEIPKRNGNAEPCNSNKFPSSYTKSESSGGELQQRQEQGELGRCNCQNNVTNTNSRRQPSEEHRKTESRQFAKAGVFNNWQNFPTVSPVCDGDDGLSSRLDTITFPKWRNESIKAGGNAIVPQVALQIFKAIEAYDKKYLHSK